MNKEKKTILKQKPSQSPDMRLLEKDEYNNKTYKKQNTTQVKTYKKQVSINEEDNFSYKVQDAHSASKVKVKKSLKKNKSIENQLNHSGSDRIVLSIEKKTEDDDEGRNSIISEEDSAFEDQTPAATKMKAKKERSQEKG